MSPLSSLLGSYETSGIGSPPLLLPEYSLASEIPESRRVPFEFRTPPLQNEEFEFRHSCDGATRHKVFEAYVNNPAITPQRLDRYSNCGSHAWAEYSPSTRRTRVSANKCRDPLCAACGREKRARVCAAIRQRVPFVQGRLRFFTLTLRGSEYYTLATMLERILTCFTALRHHKEWKKHVVGGMWSREVKRGKGSGYWHVHLHLILEGVFWDDRDLSKLWLMITGDSWNVHIKEIDDQQQLEDKIGYVSKYATKPMDQTVFNCKSDLEECILALKGKRQFNFLGTWRKLMIDEEDESAGVDDWCAVAPLPRLVRLARQGQLWAQAVLDSLTKHELMDIAPPFRPKLEPTTLALPPPLPAPYLPGLFS